MEENTNKLGEIDGYSKKIISILAKEGRLSVTELAKRIGLSKSPTQVRLKMLQEHGYITGFRAILNPHMLAREHISFVEVRLSNTKEQALQDFNEAILGIPEIEQCHMIAGAFDYLLKVRTKDIRDYRRILGEAISELPYVSSSSTHVVMQSVKDVAL